MRTATSAIRCVFWQVRLIKTESRQEFVVAMMVTTMVNQSNSLTGDGERPDCVISVKRYRGRIHADSSLIPGARPKKRQRHRQEACVCGVWICVFSHSLSSIMKHNQTVLSYTHTGVSKDTDTHSYNMHAHTHEQPDCSCYVINRQRKWHCRVG